MSDCANCDRLTAALAEAEKRGWEKAKQQAVELAADSFQFDGVVNNPQDSYAQCRALTAKKIAAAILAMEQPK